MRYVAEAAACGSVFGRLELCYAAVLLPPESSKHSARRVQFLGSTLV
jgi:hypothetical protein